MSDVAVDVLVDPWDLRALGKKQVDCLQVDPDLFKPIPAISKSGFSSAAMFGRNPGGRQPARKLHGEITVESLRPNYQGTRDLSIKDYARLFDKYYDTAHGSRIDRMVAKSKMTQDPLLDASIDTEIERRASREPRVKYLSAALADKYQVHALTVTGAPPKPPQILGLAMVPVGSSGSHLPPELLATQQDTHSSTRVLELAQTLAESDRYRSQQAEIQAKSEEDARRAYVSRASAPLPASQVFRTTTRDQAERCANRTGQRGMDVPGPGKYTVKWDYWDKPPPNTMLVKPCYKDEMTPQKQRRAEWAAEREQQQQEGAGVEARARPASAAPLRASAAGGGGGWGGGGGTSTSGWGQAEGAEDTQERPYSAAGHLQCQASTLRRSSSGLFSRANSMRLSQMGGDMNFEVDKQGDILESRGARPKSAKSKGDKAGGGGIRSAAGRAALFSNAHHVHGRVPTEHPTEGTSSFKAVPRPPLKNAGGNGGTHLALKYFNEGIDAMQRRSAHLVLPFGRQTKRPSITSARGSTTSALGPGAYIRGEQPTSLTGRHVEAGHKGIKHAPNFAKMTSRPGSAPPNHSAHSYQGAPVSEAASQGALLGMFGEELNPSELICVQELESQTLPDHTRFTQPPSSPQAQHQPQSPQGIMGLGPDQLVRYSSSGLAKPIPGGSFTRTTRAQEVQAMRAVSDGRIIPPASAPLQKIRPMQAADVIYDQTEPTVQGMHPRSPAWTLPPNRVAMSRQWISAAALAYV